jgi:N-6 DNA Methylase
MSRLHLTRNAPQQVQHYAETTRSVVEDIAAALEPLFSTERTGQVGRQWGRDLDRLFALWCEQGGLVPQKEARSAIKAVENPTRTSVRKVVRKDLGFTDDAADKAVDEYVIAVRAGTDQTKALRRLLQVLYAPHIRALCLQSAHVTLARAVLYRILEDQELATERISGKALASALKAAQDGLIGASDTPAITLLDDMRRETENFLPLLYGLRELDWWQIPTVQDNRQQELFHRHLGPVEVTLQSMLEALDGYDFSAVDRDVWKDVYQHHLPWEERQRLGSFYTPDALVDLALDVADWRAAGSGIDSKTIADISCGSGAFLVEALRRKRIAMEDRNDNRLTSDPEPEQLDELMSGIVGFDVHPFATFLASINLTFQVIDLYNSVRHRHPKYSLPLNIFTVDSLEDRGLHIRQAKLHDKLPEDIRIRHTEQEIERYRELRHRRFDVVVGNPPWGGILKGRLSPLFDPEKRKEYKDDFASATGKYDIYVLFIERSLSWLRNEGRYALVVPNTFRERDFGEGIREFLADHAPPDVIADFGPFGQLFFRAMNAPSVISGSVTDRVTEASVVFVGRQFKHLSPDRTERQLEVVGAAESALDDGNVATGVSIYREPGQELRMWRRAPWHLHPERALRRPLSQAGAVSAAELFEPKQGVTPGGEGVLDIFQMTADQTSAQGLDVLPTEVVNAAGGWPVAE